jgi:hypothetical protein
MLPSPASSHLSDTSRHAANAIARAVTRWSEYPSAERAILVKWQTNGEETARLLVKYTFVVATALHRLAVEIHRLARSNAKE